MRIAFLMFCLLACSACAHVDRQVAYSANSQRGVVVYESIFDVDLLIQKVDLEQRRPVGRRIMLPATHRIGSVSISSNGASLGYKELDPGAYAIVNSVSALSTVTVEDSAWASNEGCREDNAIVFLVEAGKIGVLPRSYYRLRDARSGGNTGIGSEGAALTAARTIVAAHPNMNAPVELLDLVAAIKFGPRTSLDLIRDSCASGESFEIVSRPE